MKTDVLLIYPKLGSGDSLILDLPLSLIYAATESVKRGYTVKILDLRLVDGDWREVLARELEQGVLLVGVSVMTGAPLKNASEVSRFIRERSPRTRIVWGGPHVTVVPETVSEPFIDFVVRAYGSVPLAELVQALKEGERDFSRIMSLSWKRDGQAVHNPRSPNFEMIRYTELPYHLVNVRSPKYFRPMSGTKIFSMFSSIGCPYQCAFCVHPAIYKEINGPKWLPYPDEDVVGHMEYAKREFGATHIVFLDDTSFPDVSRMRRLFELIVERGLGLTLEFRGARVNEIMKMDDDFIDLMVRAGGRLLMVGGESGSDRMLKELGKGITQGQILEVNRKLARHPELRVMYSFFYGSPGETYDDILESKHVVMSIVRDNPMAYINIVGDWKPVPGTRTLEMAMERYGYVPPKTLDEWVQVDSLDFHKKAWYPWYNKKLNGMIKLMHTASFFIDSKIETETRNNTSLKFRLIRLAAKLYKPILVFRLRRDLYHFLIEYNIVNVAMRFL